MTHDIPSNEWKSFFDELSKKYFEWNTRVEVLNSNIGDQTLADKLPLNGITFEGKKASGCVELIVGYDEENHQTHTVWNPEKVLFKEGVDDSKPVVEIVEIDGTKTIVHLLEPVPKSVRIATPQDLART